MVGEPVESWLVSAVEPWWASKRGACDFSYFLDETFTGSSILFLG
jgi:hypothetical protein